MTLDCQSCGACCRGWAVPVDPTDPVPARLVKWDDVMGTIMRERDHPSTRPGSGTSVRRNPGCGTCTALKGKIGERVKCSIYEKRPSVCREFVVGSSECLDARKRAGLTAAWAFYVVRCADGSLYAGTTTDVSRRVREHNESPRGARYTRARRPVILALVERVADRSAALKAEAAFRKLSKRAKEALIAMRT